jgi:carboxymethylenebutenolidase
VNSVSRMEQHQRYLAEEVAYDHADGLISRRDALRQLGRLGFGVVAASALLAACGSDDDADDVPTLQTAPATSAPPGSATAVPTEAVTYPGKRGTLQGAWAAAATPKGAVVVVHENRGLTDHIRSVAGRLAGEGYSALAVDLLSQEGGTAAVQDPQGTLGAAQPDRFLDDMRSTVDELGRRQPGAKLGVIGFCFGGGMAWLLAENEPRLAAAAPFYGQVRQGADFSRAKAAVLAVYAERDNRVNATMAEARAALEKAGLAHRIEVFPGADHAFFNDTGPRYNPEQAAAAYRAVLDWFGRYLG